MKILIIGAGSIGCLFGVKLALKSHEITAIGSNNVYMTIQKQGFIFEVDGKKYSKFPSFHFFSKDSFYEEYSNEAHTLFFDYCIVACKSYSLSQIISEYHYILSQFSRIFLLQNGLGNEEILKLKYPEMNVYRIISTMGAELVANHHLIQTGSGLNYVCHISSFICETPFDLNDIEPIHYFVQILNEADISTEISEKSLQKIWEKAIVNMVINPIGALWRKTNGELLTLSYFWEIAEDIISEILSILDEYKISINSKDQLLQIIKNILQLTQQNSNSMLQDLKRNKHTEIEFLNQKVVDLAKNKKKTAPFNRLVVNLVKGIEKRN
ncbi:MAG: hypothetical protein DRO88_07275 [Promethearchaeia archaeon]|nr:MAG: hypothetical protein DRO88_07275 [Candidatus Lokiarchaeia archaeon]